MRTLVTYLVAASLTLHMLLGCCWHHAHEGSAVAKESKATVPAKKEVAAGTKRCRCHRHQPVATVPQAEHQNSHREAPSPHSDSCGEKCSFVVAIRVQLDQDQLPCAASFGLLVDVISLENTRGFTGYRYETWDRAESPPPVRLHLLHQLLLI